MRVHGEEAYARGVHTRYHKVCPDVALVAEEVLLKHRHAGHHAGLAACGEGMQLELRGDERSGELGVCGRPSACAPDLGGDVVQLFAVLEGMVSSPAKSLGGVLWMGEPCQPRLGR